MTRPALFAAAVLMVVTIASAGCSTFSGSTDRGMANWIPAGEGPRPGTAEWWSRNKKKAELVPGEGYRVPGVAGFFDANGRPMTSAMSEDSLVLDRPEDRTQGILPGLDPKKQYASARKAIGLGPNQASARQAYEDGQNLYAEKKFLSAARKFKEASSRWPDSTIEQQSLYQEANCYFFSDKYASARDTYVRLMEKYPSSPHMNTTVERMWAIGQYWEKTADEEGRWTLTPNMTDKTQPWFDTSGHALKTYENIQLYDPTGPRADDAIMASAGIHFRRGRFNDADHFYRLLRQEYPRSDFQFEAHLLGLQTKLQKYQGPDYDGAPLEEAKKLAKQLQLQFAGRLSPEQRDRLATTRAEVARAIAERDLRMAQHYEKTEHYASARYYYGQLIKNHPDTQLAQQATERLAQISDRPGVPEERLAWLIDWFPENPERARVARVEEIQPSSTRLAENTKTDSAVKPANGEDPFDPVAK